MLGLSINDLLRCHVDNGFFSTTAAAEPTTLVDLCPITEAGTAVVIGVCLYPGLDHGKVYLANPEIADPSNNKLEEFHDQIGGSQTEAVPALSPLLGWRWYPCRIRVYPGCCVRAMFERALAGSLVTLQARIYILPDSELPPDPPAKYPEHVLKTDDPGMRRVLLAAACSRTIQDLMDEFP